MKKKDSKAGIKKETLGKSFKLYVFFLPYSSSHSTPHPTTAQNAPALVSPPPQTPDRLNMIHFLVIRKTQVGKYSHPIPTLVFF